MKLDYQINKILPNGRKSLVRVISSDNLKNVVDDVLKMKLLDDGDYEISYKAENTSSVTLLLQEKNNGT